MSDIEENAFHLARYFVEHGLRPVPYNWGEVRQGLNLSKEDFEKAYLYLKNAGYCHMAGQIGNDVDAVIFIDPGMTVFYNTAKNERVDLSSDAERLLRFLADKTPYFPFQPILDTFSWDEKRYVEAAQTLCAEGFVIGSFADGNQFFTISITDPGRQTVRRNFRNPSPYINWVHTGDNITIENSGSNSVIAAGRHAKAQQGLSGAEIDQLFQDIFRQLELRADIPDAVKNDLKDTVELIQEEVAKGDKVNEKTLKHLFRTLQRMAPDILEVTIAAATNPLLAASIIVKKITEKMKADSI